MLACSSVRKNEGGVDVVVVFPCPAGAPPPDSFASDNDFDLDLPFLIGDC